jgi:endonuclease YncB( thermonuclease family)
MKNFIIFIATLFFSVGIHAAELKGKVVSIADGDTITILDHANYPNRVRLAGIDAPEKSQAFGQVSKRSLSDLIYGRMVKVDWVHRDRYGRIIGKVTIDGLDVCLEQIRHGMAWHYKHYAAEQPATDRQTYADAENAARSGKLGLWHDPKPVAPWDFRKQR